MNAFVKFIGSTVVAAIVIVGGSVLASTQAHAVPFGTTTAGIVGSSTIAFANVTSTIITMTGSNPRFTSRTGQLVGASVTGTSTGGVHYTRTVGVITANAVTNLFTFGDGGGGGGVYAFDLASATTLSYSSVSGRTVISLYMLGSMHDTFAGLTSTATSITMSLNDNSNGPFSWSASLSNPPASYRVPEPVSLLILGTGIAGLGLARRRKAA